MSYIYNFDKSIYAKEYKDLTVSLVSDPCSPEWVLSILIYPKLRRANHISYVVKLTNWLEHYKLISDMGTIGNTSTNLKLASIGDGRGILVLGNKDYIKLLYQDSNLKLPSVSLEFNETNTPGLVKGFYKAVKEQYKSITAINTLPISGGRSGDEPLMLSVLAEGYNREVDSNLFEYDTSFDVHDLYTSDKFIKIVLDGSCSIIIRNDPYSIIRLSKMLARFAGFAQGQKIRIRQAFTPHSPLDSYENVRVEFSDVKMDEHDINMVKFDRSMIEAVIGFEKYLFNKYS